MRRTVLLLAAMLTAILLVGVGQGPAHAEVTAVKGSAYGYFGSVSLFGGPPNTRGPTPTVTLPSSGSATPITATASTGLVQFGPAIFFTSGPITVSTQGKTGLNESVISTTNIQSVNTSGNEVFTADNVSSRCTASEAGTGGSTTITNGTLQTSEGDPNVEGDETVIQVPTNPAPNTTYEGQIESVGDSFRYVFNEQTRSPDGSITVNAAHQYLLGPTAVGDLIVGQSVCGVTAPPDDVAPAAPVITNPQNNSYDTDSTIAFSGTAEAKSTVRIFEGTALRGTTTAGADGSWSKTLSGVANGRHTYTARATDKAGNTSAASTPRTVTVDTQKPSISGLKPKPGSRTPDRTPTIKAIVKDNLTNLPKGNIKLFLDGKKKANFSYNRSTNRLTYTSKKLKFGKHAVKIVARDAAGNVAVKSWRFKVVRR